MSLALAEEKLNYSVIEMYFPMHVAFTITFRFANVVQALILIQHNYYIKGVIKSIDNVSQKPENVLGNVVEALCLLCGV